jgi:hypothetical protein
LLDGGLEPWTGARPSGLGDPQGVTELPGKPEQWQSAQVGDSQIPGGFPGGVPPMAPPVSPSQLAANAEWSDASGLLEGERESWTGVDVPSLGEPLDVAPPAGEPERWGQSTADDVNGLPVLPPAAPHGAVGREPAHTKASESLDDGRTEWGSAALSGEDDESAALVPAPPMEDRVAVVQPSGAGEDLAAWDVGAAGGLLWLAAATKKKEEKQVPHTPDHALRETTPWERAVSHTSAHAVRPLPVPAEDPLSHDAFQSPPEKLPDGQRCAGDDADEDYATEVKRRRAEAEAAAAEEEEEKERRSVDLLRQDGHVWSGKPKLNSSGVIE